MFGMNVHMAQKITRMIQRSLHLEIHRCIAEFFIHQLQFHPNVVEIYYYHIDHIQVDGTLSYGLNNLDLISRKTTHRPRLFNDLMT